jgi:hypothetical protein
MTVIGSRPARFLEMASWMRRFDGCDGPSRVEDDWLLLECIKGRCRDREQGDHQKWV